MLKLSKLFRTSFEKLDGYKHTILNDWLLTVNEEQVNKSVFIFQKWSRSFRPNKGSFHFFINLHDSLKIPKKFVPK